MSTLAVAATQWLLQANACPTTNPSCASRPPNVVRQPIFDGFGVHQFLIIGSAALATLVGLIVVSWLLVHLTGAHRDYAQLQARQPAPGHDPARATVPGMGMPPTYPSPRPPRPQIAPSTWVGVVIVFALALGAATWIAFTGDDTTTTTTPSTTATAGPATTVAPAASVTTVPSSCPKPALTATFLPPGFLTQLMPGFGATPVSDPGCAYHWQGNNGVVISLLPTGYSPIGPPGETQQKIVLHGRTFWIGPTPGGGLGIVIEDKELGGAPDIWFTLMSTTVARNDLIETAADLQRA
ncbi:MAG: hypothetical protein E6G39_14205 [Actinobacteria bacterium]|nr:MAG: hypothetical protein E6G39_14205 [Actinomycetota bacterium]